mmetsp:Transcript_14608/g.41512  ORF Transcript_14608/g.41512 Transcript_14608/m.41512 type:complete len:280 (+) Transcript_14608:343-1182(+)
MLLARFKFRRWCCSRAMPEGSLRRQLSLSSRTVSLQRAGGSRGKCVSLLRPSFKTRMNADISMGPSTRSISLFDRSRYSRTIMLFTATAGKTRSLFSERRKTFSMPSCRRLAGASTISFRERFSTRRSWQWFSGRGTFFRSQPRMLRPWSALPLDSTWFLFFHSIPSRKRMRMSVSPTMRSRSELFILMPLSDRSRQRRYGILRRTSGSWRSWLRLRSRTRRFVIEASSGGRSTSLLFRRYSRSTCDAPITKEGISSRRLFDKSTIVLLSSSLPVLKAG